MSDNKFLKTLTGIILILLMSTIVLGSTGNPNPIIEPKPLYTTVDAECEAIYLNDNDDIGSLTFNWYVAGENIQQTEFQDLDDGEIRSDDIESSNYVSEDEVACEVIAESETGDITTELDNIIAIRAEPEFTEERLYFENISEDQEFLTSSFVEHPEGITSITECSGEFETMDGETRSLDGQIDETYGDVMQGECTLEPVGADYDVVEPLNLVNVTMTLTDIQGDENSLTENNTVPNSLPEVFNIQPEDNSLISEDSAELSIQVFNENDEQLDAVIYDSEGNILASEDDMDDFDKLTYTLTDLEKYDTTRWSVEVTDGYEKLNRAFRFVYAPEPNYRVNAGLRHDYSSIIMPVQSSRLMQFDIKNPHESPKELDLSIEGVEGYFEDTDESTMTINLDGGGSQIYNVILEPSQNGTRTMSILIDEKNTVVTVNKSTEVFAHPRASATAAVPGLNSLYLVLLLLLVYSIFYYSEQL